MLCRVALPDGGAGLAGSSSALSLQNPAPCQWHIYPSHNGPWLRLSAAADAATDGEGALCLDLSNPEQLPQLAPEEDVSGQYWQAEKQMGCKKLEGGAVARCLLGYKLHAMWTGSEQVLTAVGDTVALKPDGSADGQVWEIQDESGALWMVPDLPEITSVEPEIAICDFAPAEEPEIAVSDFEPSEEIQMPPPMLCGGLAPQQEGGPSALLEQVREEAQTWAQGMGWKGVFTMFEPVANRTQVVAGTNHFCKVCVGENVYAHITVHEPLPGRGPPRVTNVDVPVGLDDTL